MLRPFCAIDRRVGRAAMGLAAVFLAVLNLACGHLERAASSPTASSGMTAAVISQHGDIWRIENELFAREVEIIPGESLRTVRLLNHITGEVLPVEGEEFAIESDSGHIATDTQGLVLCHS